METVLLGQGGEHQDGVVRINHKSDFPLEVKVVRNGVAENFPDADFTLTAKTEGGFTVYKAERKAGVYSHCKRDGERLIMFFDNHGLAKGRLIVSAVINHPDADYTEDGIRQENLTTTTNIELVEDNGDALQLQLPEPRVVEKEIPLPAEIKELSEAVSKVMEYNPEAGSEGLFNENDNVFDALVSQELLKLPKDIIHSGNIVGQVNNFLKSTSSKLEDEMPFMEQMSRIALLKACAQSNGIGMPIPFGIFNGVWLNQLNLTLRGPIYIRSMFINACIYQLRIYLTEEFEIVSDATVTVNSNSSHEEWVNFRNSENDLKMTIGKNDGKIERIHLKFDANKLEQAITLICNLGLGTMRQVYLEATEPIDGKTFHRWLVEALKPYTDSMRAQMRLSYIPTFYIVGDNFGANGGQYFDFFNDYKKKGYNIIIYDPIDDSVL